MNFRCDLCQIMVPDQDTLDKHMRGKDHLKKQQHPQFVPRAGEFPDAELQYIHNSEVNLLHQSDNSERKVMIFEYMQ